MSGLRRFAAPLRYVQGPGALDELPALLAPYGRPLVVTDPVVQSLLGSRLATLLADLAPAYLVLDGEITAAAADALTADAPPEVSVVVGIGGGKAIDAGKAVSLRLGLPVVTVPTAASNDSPCSGVAAMYDDDHRLASVDKLPANPHVVVVDTTVIVAAPIRLLRSGIGDAIAKRFEARACLAGTGVTSLGTRPLLIGSAIADACYSVLREHAADAVADAQSGTITPAFEATVEASVLMSGLGFENGGLSLAHSLTRGLMVAAPSATHGEHVAWGTLVQLAVEGASDQDLADLRSFLTAIGLPTTLAGLGSTVPYDVDGIAEATMQAPHLANLAAPVTADDLGDAIRRLELSRTAGLCPTD
ncbi:iron-containing alcohol dehydrogenase [Nocardioides sp. URHA0032]|uniref:iron-containing alcohol dehydrogenase n=1 Tax=Nocardioides sp. URHA0032 TaxID=1380388 RepID=UPI00048BD9DF|nr:iron-containing alcohol dehydrogenase [Nocardioides sp. URHA0032]